MEAMTTCGEMEKKGRFSKIVEALHDDHTALKVFSCFLVVLEYAIFSIISEGHLMFLWHFQNCKNHEITIKHFHVNEVVYIYDYL